MITMLRQMQKKNSGIPGNVLPVFEGIVKKYEEVGIVGRGNELNAEFCQAMDEHLTREQRYKLYETNGSCNGAGADKERKAFAVEYAHLALDERMALFAETFKRWKPVLNDDNTLTLTFKCSHGYYKRAREGKPFTPPSTLQSYFESCAGGRLYELQKALGIKLKIKSVDISPLSENANNPVLFMFDIVE